MNKTSRINVLGSNIQVLKIIIFAITFSFWESKTFASSFKEWNEQYSLIPNSLLIGYSRYTPLFSKMDGSECENCNYVSYSSENDEIKLLEQKENSLLGPWISSLSLHQFHSVDQNLGENLGYFFESRFSYIHISQTLTLKKTSDDKIFKENLDYQIIYYGRLLRLSLFFSSQQLYVLTGLGVAAYYHRDNSYIDGLASLGLGWISNLTKDIYFETEINLIPFLNPILKNDNFSILGISSITLGFGYKIF